MNTRDGFETKSTSNSNGTKNKSRRRLRRRLLTFGICIVATVAVLLGAAAWLGSKATTIKSELQSATSLMPTLKKQIADNDASGAAATVGQLSQRTQTAKDAATDPLWRMASALPFIGANFEAVTEVATSADDVARLGAEPLVKVFESLDWATLTPATDGMDLAPVQTAAPKVQAAAYAVKESVQRLNSIDTSNLVPQVAEPLVEARSELALLQGDLNLAADATKIAPTMLGADTSRRYLLLMQNNAESRATGGIPGALAVLSVNKGKLNLESQSSATALGSFVPPVAVDAEQQTIFSARLGKFMQDVNLTPDFPTTAATAKSMWERSTGERLDGVISLDPVALSFILNATGPVKISDPAVLRIGNGLPTELTGSNVVRTLLSDAYAKIREPELQDVYFAAAAKEIFSALSSGQADSKKLMDALSKGAAERRILLWSASTSEQVVIGNYPLGGMVSGAAVSATQFGIYFNDGTGAKMDYWMKRSVQVVKDCTRDGYREVTLRVTSTNTAAPDAAQSLPPYVTGNGAFGVPAGSVQTNVVAYGPAQSNVDTVVKDGDKVPFAAQRHGQRSVGTSTIQLAPGATTSVDFNFGHIVQQGQPEIVVTPTTQLVKDVVQAPAPASCE